MWSLTKKSSCRSFMDSLSFSLLESHLLFLYHADLSLSLSFSFSLSLCLSHVISLSLSLAFFFSLFLDFANILSRIYDRNALLVIRPCISLFPFLCLSMFIFISSIYFSHPRTQTHFYYTFTSYTLFI